MNIFQSVILGAVEGFTEFLPVSSTAHLIIASKMVGIPRRNEYNSVWGIPTIFAASLYDLYKSKNVLMHSKNNEVVLVVGFIVTFAVAYASIRWLLDYLRHHSLAVFGYYRIVLAIIVVLLFLR